MRMSLSSLHPTGNGWNYHVELPDVLPRIRFTRATVGVLLREYAGRNATSNSRLGEIPQWFVDGLSLHLLTSGGRENHFVVAQQDRGRTAVHPNRDQ